MESSSDVSSISSKHEQNQVPSIHLQQLILDQHARNLSSIHDSNVSSKDSLHEYINRKNYPKIFTVAQTLKDPLILNHIKPDYGSLGDFIGDINIGRDLLNNQKKKKNQGNEEENQEKKIKNSLKDKNQEQLNQVFTSKNSTAVQKKVAGKLLVQSLFKDSFGMSLTNFESQNVKVQNNKNYKINLLNIDEIFNGQRQTATRNQQATDKKTIKLGANNKQQLDLNQSTSKQIYNWTQRQRTQALEQIKNKYPTLRRLQIKKQCKDYDKLFPKLSQQQDYSQSKRTDKSSDRQKFVHVVEVSATIFKVQKLAIKPQVLLYMLSQNPIQKLDEIVLNQVRIPEQLLCFFLQTIKTVSLNLSKLTLRALSIQKTQNVANKIKQLLQALNIKQLNIEFIDLETKQFCIICLGIGSNSSLQNVSFDNNNIDQRASKSLQLISKHCANLKKISLRKNYLQSHHFSYFNTQFKNKIVI